MQYWFTADEHYGHTNIIKFQNRPFSSIEAMDKELIKRNNTVVKKDDVVVHVGDFAWKGNKRFVFEKYISKLVGIHIFVRGSHDSWMDKTYHEIWEKKINEKYIVACHYAMRVWPRHHYGSWHLYGHSHGNLPHYGCSFDVGVDCWDYFPVSFEQVCKKIKSLTMESEKKETK